MTSYHIDKDYEDTLDFLKKEVKQYVKDGYISGLSMVNLISTLKKYNKIIENKNEYNYFFSDPFSEHISTRLLQTTSRSVWNTLNQELIDVLCELGYDKYDYTDTPTISLTTVLSKHKRPVKCTFKGSFILKNPIPNELQKSCSTTIVDGDITIDNGFRGKQIELPNALTATKVITTSTFNGKKEYKSVKDYVNRPERLERLAAARIVRQKTKKANDSGVLTFTDFYGVPLEVGCIVSYSCGGYISICKVVKQTTKQVVLKHLHHDATSNAHPSEIMRIR